MLSKNIAICRISKNVHYSLHISILMNANTSEMSVGHFFLKEIYLHINFHFQYYTPLEL